MRGRRSRAQLADAPKKLPLLDRSEGDVRQVPRGREGGAIYPLTARLALASITGVVPAVVPALQTGVRSGSSGTARPAPTHEHP